ncbi:hypothetical protein [Pararobbsia alpina]|uniref:Uncharacterized protein n=1 Tax=Pararobbsia alpina TaxID=621374 RepID=A0A6S7BWZ0_9BURK|nr:hypothetical protein [Pararobbsia alpina]CAB3796331.1 hypothetical protein LMG28138_04054 [Pararobbsia alpina]
MNIDHFILIRALPAGLLSAALVVASFNVHAQSIGKVVLVSDSGASSTSTGNTSGTAGGATGSTVGGGSTQGGTNEGGDKGTGGGRGAGSAGSTPRDTGGY